MDMIIKMLRNMEHEDVLERCDAIEYLASFLNDDQISEKIINAFDDVNYLVRCEAYEAFYGYSKNDINDKLIKRLRNEKSKYARMYLCSTLSSVIKYFSLNKNQKEKILSCYKKEKEINVLIGFWSLLYMDEKNDSYVIKILNCINNENYHVRCNVVNFLSEIIDESNREMIISKMKKQLKIEENKAVKELIYSFIRDNIH